MFHCTKHIIIYDYVAVFVKPLISYYPNITMSRKGIQEDLAFHLESHDPEGLIRSLLSNNHPSVLCWNLLLRIVSLYPTCLKFLVSDTYRCD